MGALVCRSREPAEPGATVLTDSPELWAKPAAASRGQAGRLPWHRTRRAKPSGPAAVVSPTGDNCPCCCAGAAAAAAAKLQPEGTPLERAESPPNKISFSRSAWETPPSPLLDKTSSVHEEEPLYVEEATDLLTDTEQQCQFAFSGSDDMTQVEEITESGGEPCTFCTLYPDGTLATTDDDDDFKGAAEQLCALYPGAARQPAAAGEPCSLCLLFPGDSGAAPRDDAPRALDDGWSNLDEEVTIMVDRVSSLSSIVEEKLRVKNKTRQDVWKGTFGIYVHHAKDGTKKIVIRDGWTSYHIQGDGTGYLKPTIASMKGWGLASDSRDG
ncbi:uncharacterized protein LOC144111339 [Amblyomma americanum]